VLGGRNGEAHKFKVATAADLVALRHNGRSRLTTRRLPGLVRTQPLGDVRSSRFMRHFVKRQRTDSETGEFCWSEGGGHGARLFDRARHPPVSGVLGGGNGEAHKFKVATAADLVALWHNGRSRLTTRRLPGLVRTQPTRHRQGIRTAIDARNVGFETYVVKDTCRGIDTNGSLAAAWKAMEKVGVKRITPRISRCEMDGSHEPG
jgi:hypothetical protein